MARILVIEDDEIMRDMLAQMMQREGYEVLTAENGRVGMERLEAQPVDLIISDIVMPEMEGMETISAIRRLDPGLPIIAISGGGRIPAGSYLQIATRLGATLAFEKPFDRATIVAAVRSCLSAS